MARSAVVDKDLGWSAIFRRLKKPWTAAVLVGIDESEGADLPLIAAENEFGTKTTPERSFLRRTVDGNRRAYLDALAEAEDDLVMGNLPVEIALAQLGERVVGDTKDAIKVGIAPENDPETLEQKQGDTPLIDTGRLIGAIKFHIEDT